eukprot:TRINITY_DN38565_c0_g2_i1.p1 TRINITY_DN38565_c0_g2~~TRINITY_DN38565_c0_g2_i1.p1  ORF type:complete len:148 (-),score=25.98 TRINITY_DN38565_c0_g2_i1:25-468(-)
MLKLAVLLCVCQVAQCVRLQQRENASEVQQGNASKVQQTEKEVPDWAPGFVHNMFGSKPNEPKVPDSVQACCLEPSMMPTFTYPSCSVGNKKAVWYDRTNNVETKKNMYAWYCCEAVPRDRRHKMSTCGELGYYKWWATPMKRALFY